jgi:hypothetical protein
MRSAQLKFAQNLLYKRVLTKTVPPIKDVPPAQLFPILGSSTRSHSSAHPRGTALEHRSTAARSVVSVPTRPIDRTQPERSADLVAARCWEFPNRLTESR